MTRASGSQSGSTVSLINGLPGKVYNSTLDSVAGAPIFVVTALISSGALETVAGAPEDLGRYLPGYGSHGGSVKSNPIKLGMEDWCVREWYRGWVIFINA